MTDLLLTLDRPYDAISRSLGEVRELFHSHGRIADSNAKLDETVKFMAIHHAFINGRLPGAIYDGLARWETFSIRGANQALAIVASQHPFADPNSSIFGNQPSIAFEAGEEKLAYEFFRLTNLAIASQALASDPLDVINEAFGHHVRDNFRSNTEDAQYMTPPEVVDFMVSLALELTRQTGQLREEDFVVLDPCCGVGSFLVAWHRAHERERRQYAEMSRPIIVGQDKVDRMARLAKANLIFSGFDIDRVFVGNSLADESALSDYDGKVDLILTNPPFGARFATADLRQSSSASLPFFASHAEGAKLVDSELLFVERYLTLLKPGGFCLVVVPDGVVSGKGIAAVTRQLIARQADLHAVIELPPVTFAQAGTRTKTAILAFRKAVAPAPARDVFFAEAEDLGFDVSKRKGVPLKRASGDNQLPDILRSFMSRETWLPDSREAFAGWRSISSSRAEVWTPRRFRPAGTESVEVGREFDHKPTPLSELVKPRAKVRTESYSPDKLFISVLHVIGEGVLDLPSVRTYRPITPGTPVGPGQVIVSRLNPRIPRVLVVPDLGVPMLCSSEFEILDPIDGISNYALAYLLLTPFVQNQICGLTAGTSASHSRVRPDEIRGIVIPWPSPADPDFGRLVSEYRAANEGIMRAIWSIAEMRANALAA